jgi:hypothetical protein
VTEEPVEIAGEVTGENTGAAEAHTTETETARSTP